MFFQIELLYFALMIATFVVLLLAAKLPSGLCLMAAAVAGVLASFLIGPLFNQGTAFELRYLVEGTFGYFDTILIITTAMIFMSAMKANGCLEYVSALIVKTFRKFPTLLLIALMIIIMFPAMVTGSSLASAITAGALVAPILIKWGVPKAKAGAVVALGSILGMVAPPINVPAMVICDAVDIAYTEFTLPLLLLSMPVAVITVLLVARKYVKPLSKEEAGYVVNAKILKEVNWTVCIPLIALVIFITGEIIFPKILGSFGMSAMFVICTALCFFVGKKMPFFVKRQKKKALFPEVPAEEGEITATAVKKLKEEQPTDIVGVLDSGVRRAFPAMGLLMGVGMFMEAIALNGVRGYFVVNAVTLPDFWSYAGMAVLMPALGGISSFGAASMLGGPFVMSMYATRFSKTLVCGLSLLAAVGEFLPPTAMSATFAAEMVGEKGWSKVTKAALPSLAVLFVYGLLYTLVFARIIFRDTVLGQNVIYGILLAVMLVVAALFAVVWGVLVKKLKVFNKYAYQVCAADVAEKPSEENREEGM